MINILSLFIKNLDK